jgi:hypothetical protein
VGHENRNVTDDLDPAIAAVGAQAVPLAVEDPLQNLGVADGRPVVTPRLLQSRRITPHQFGFPRMPGLQVVRLLESHEEGEILQPVRVAVAELGEGLLLLRCGLPLESAAHRAQNGHAGRITFP